MIPWRLEHHINIAAKGFLAWLNVRSREELEYVLDASARLRNLQELDATGAGLHELPEDISKLTGLTALTLDHNQLTDLPDAVGRLRALRSLNLAGNKLTSVPGVITRIRTISSLDLSCNRLASLPEALRQLPLTYLDIRFNPGLGLDHSVVSQLDSPQQVLAQHFAARKSRLLAVKVVVLGDSPETPHGRLGKTCICRRLSGLEADEHQSITRGFDRFRLVPPPAIEIDGAPRDVEAALFDFGGQRRLLSSHRFFVATRRHIYILCGDARKDLADSRLRHWVQFVQDMHTQTVRAEVRAGRQERGLYTPTQSPGGPAVRDAPFASRVAAVGASIPVSPMIIVTTHCEPRADQPLLAEPDRGRLADLAHANGLVLVTPYDNFHDPGNAMLGVVRAAIRDAMRGMPELRDQVAESLVAVRENIRHLFDRERRLWIPAAEFAERCMKVVPPLGRCSQQDVSFHLRVLRDLGDVHWVGDRDDLHAARSAAKDCVFDPERVRDPVYEILWRKPSEPRKAGFITEGWVHSTLSEQGLGQDDMHRVAELMRLCGLLFPVFADRETLLLVPDHFAAFEDAPLPERNLWDRVGESEPLGYVPDSLMPRLRGMFGKETFDHPDASEAPNRFFMKRGSVEAFMHCAGGQLSRITIGAKGGTVEQREVLTGRVVLAIEQLLKRPTTFQFGTASESGAA